MLLLLALPPLQLIQAAVEVLVAASRSHYPGLIAVVGSAANSSAKPEELRFHLLVSEDESPDEIRAALSCACPSSSLMVQRFTLGNWARGSQLTTNARLAEPLNYVRFFIGQLLPHASTAIYLDSDVHVQDDLLKLHNEARRKLDAEPRALVAVVPRDHKKVCGHLIDCQKVTNIQDRLHAFNAGVLVFDLVRWRAEKMLDQVERWVIANQRGGLYALGSNPPLVLAVQDRFVRLDPRWNCMHGLRRQHEHNLRCWPDAKIRHFPGDTKPWSTIDSLHRTISDWGGTPQCASSLRSLIFS